MELPRPTNLQSTTHVAHNGALIHNLQSIVGFMIVIPWGGGGMRSTGHLWHCNVGGNPTCEFGNGMEGGMGDLMLCS
jgi:hypothetical protein